MQKTVSRTDDGNQRNIGKERNKEIKDKEQNVADENSNAIEKMYESVCEFCFRYLGFVSFDQVDRITIPEYMLLVKVHVDAEEEKEYDRHWRAYLNMAAQATVKSGKRQKMKYPTFNKFYNRDEIVKRIHGESNEMDEITARTIDFRRKRGN